MYEKQRGLNINDLQEPMKLVLWEGHFTEKSDDRVGHLNTILARGGGILNDPIFKSSNARGLPGGGGRNVEISS